MSKTLPGVAFTLLFLDFPENPLTGGPDFDLTVGSPATGIGDLLGGDEASLWRYYVHCRLAWESAGDLSRALSWNERGFADISKGDDNSLECLLNKVSESAYSSLSVEVMKTFACYLSGLASNKTKSGTKHRELRGRLNNAGLLWRPLREVRLRPTPWAARAFLRRSEDLENKRQIHPLLRGCLVCAPLAREIVGRCFDLEARVRSVHGTLGGRGQMSEQCRTLWDRFQREDPNSEVRYYPKECPAWPCDESELASFGEFLNSIKPLFYEEHHFVLLALRNALAHGHYLSWRVVQELRHIENLERA